MVLESGNKKLKSIERRLSRLELIAHEPVDWEYKIKSLEDAYNRLYNLFQNLKKER